MRLKKRWRKQAFCAMNSLYVNKRLFFIEYLWYNSPIYMLEVIFVERYGRQQEKEKV